MRIVPAIDIIDGKCVRLEKGDYQKKTIYNEDPLEVAKSFEDHGVEYLHLVDLDGAKAGKVVNYSILDRIASQTGLSVDFGGGVRAAEDIDTIFDYGGSQAVVGSLAFKNPDLFFSILTQFTSDKIILGADAHHGKIAVGGWLESTDMDVIEIIKDYVDRGVQYILSTDIEKDGMLKGPSVDLYREILEVCPKAYLIASGGVTNLDDLEELQAIGCESAIVGKAIYENRISLKEIENWILSNGVSNK
ncbi:1-(5-phosphoribosyl)-5-[(5-phosphoribosylamino)methylideneamino]imidazole-4-carboxamide isomerase [Membranihabitans marinus]|uniref:1-(5-phosphoribosyl)-5-[(5- phosphoribosylamino)methylideneamino]imidazole-4- carboxamide isomerase n=1 Tax=Membranihabitans marinus TaxID=1227546 RepID=UPI001EFFE041|nr:1-(5-phosphoribosyl)-5-[(5-phosphoribosylamino)methylideneamino]imidazole-4-carboxamide isomerase [Membranihabitans marinus]